MNKYNKITTDDQGYLQILAHVAKPPRSLYCLGNLPERRQASVAIVGSRKPTAYGREVTQKLAYDLAAKGIVIVSGLALGVDGIAHRAALEAGGTTIAVLANGLPGIYPASHRQLAAEIVKNGGAILSEYEPESLARGFQFLERNRIVAGLADAVIITEAASRSGTLNTAMHALEQGKELLVVPGNITSPMSAGCNRLLQQGASPILSADDVLSVVAPDLIEKQTSLILGNNPEEVTIITLLKAGVRDGEELQQKSQLTASVFSTTLTMLELGGVVKPLGANQWTLG